MRENAVGEINKAPAQETVNSLDLLHCPFQIIKLILLILCIIVIHAYNIHKNQALYLYIFYSIIIKYNVYTKEIENVFMCLIVVLTYEHIHSIF